MSEIPEEYSAINLRMKIAEIEPEKAAALWGTPGVITAMNAYFNEAILAEREANAKIAETIKSGFWKDIAAAIRRR